MTIRVMTFNIRNGLAEDGVNSWQNRRHLTAKVIRESNADIIGLQEVFDFQLHYLMAELPEYAFYSVGREDGYTQGEQCSILWRRGQFQRTGSGTFWLSDSPDVPNSMTWGNRITRICSWVEFAGGLQFLNTHWDHESSNARRKSAELIVDVLPVSSWILVGDFNAEPAWPDMEPLSRLDNARFVTKDNAIGTFHNFQGGGDGDCIDHAFVSSNLAARTVSIVTECNGDVYPSDHYPVILEVRL